MTSDEKGGFIFLLSPVTHHFLLTEEAVDVVVGDLGEERLLAVAALGGTAACLVIVALSFACFACSAESDPKRENATRSGDVLTAAEVSPDIRVKDLSEDDVRKISRVLEEQGGDALGDSRAVRSVNGNRNVSAARRADHGSACRSGCVQPAADAVGRPRPAGRVGKPLDDAGRTPAGPSC